MKARTYLSIFLALWAAVALVGMRSESTASALTLSQSSCIFGVDPQGNCLPGPTATTSCFSGNGAQFLCVPTSLLNVGMQSVQDCNGVPIPSNQLCSVQPLGFGVQVCNGIQISLNQFCITQPLQLPPLILVGPGAILPFPTSAGVLCPDGSLAASASGCLTIAPPPPPSAAISQPTQVPGRYCTDPATGEQIFAPNGTDCPFPTSGS
ncbi:MAG: hypothetical protein ACR2PL_03175 [Dehalococcoidia bacterium]